MIAPRLVDFGAVTLHQAAYQLRYEYGPDGFTLQNLAPIARSFEVDLSALDPRSKPQTVHLAPGASWRADSRQ